MNGNNELNRDSNSL